MKFKQRGVDQKANRKRKTRKKGQTNFFNGMIMIAFQITAKNVKNQSFLSLEIISNKLKEGIE